AEIGEYAIAHVSGDEPTRLGDLLATAPVVRADNLPQILGIELGRHNCRADKISEQHCELTPLGLVPASPLGCTCGLVEFGNCAQHSLAMPERDSNFFEVLVSQIA